MSSSGSDNSSHVVLVSRKYLFSKLCRKCVQDNEESYNLQLAAVLENGSGRE